MPAAWKRSAPTFSHFDDESSPTKSAQGSKDERTVTMACFQPADENGLPRPSRL
jgi:hypothetical protein